VEHRLAESRGAPARSHRTRSGWRVPRPNHDWHAIRADLSMIKRQSAIALGLVMLITASPLVGGALAVNFGADAAQNPTVQTNVTKAVHEMGWSATEYEDDGGSVTELPATANETYENPYSYALDGVNATDYGAFPHSKDDVSALDASEWSKDVSGSAGSATIANTETEPGVDAVSLSTSSQTSSDTAKFTMSNFSVTSDAEKRMLQVGMNINTLASGATVEVRAVDADGDYVAATANPSQTGGQSEIASSTGDGYMFQRQVGEMTVSGTGDGTMGEIQKTVVVVSDEDADVDIYALNTEKTGKWNFGDQRVDSDGDGDYDSTETLYEVNGSSAGQVSVTDLSTLGTTFSSATLHDVTIPMDFEASELDADDIKEEYESADQYPNFDTQADVYYRLQLPDAYDLSYADAELTDTVALPGDRYQTVEYAEGSSADLGNESSYSDITGSYGSAGAAVSVDSTVSVGTNMVIHYDYVLTGDEASALQASDSAGGGVLGDSALSNSSTTIYDTT